MKYLITILILITSINVNAQPFVGLEYGTIGAGLNVGYMAECKIELKTGFNTPLIKTDVPTIYYISLGKEITFFETDESSITLIPSLGYSIITIQDFTDYERGGSIHKMDYYKPKMSLELGKNKHIGRMYISVNYTDRIYYNAGIRAFFK